MRALRRIYTLNNTGIFAALYWGTSEKCVSLPVYQSIMHCTVITRNVMYRQTKFVLYNITALALACDVSPEVRFDNGYTLLEQAIYNNELNVITLLVGYKADVNANYGRPLQFAVGRLDNIPDMRTFVDTMFNTFQGGSGHIKPSPVSVLDILIRAGADVNLRRQDAMSIVSAAINDASAEHVSRLLKAGAILHPQAKVMARYSKVDTHEKVALLQGL